MKSIDNLREYVLTAASVNATTRAVLAGYADEIESEVDDMWHLLTIDAKPMTDENMAESGMVPLPLDADGVPIHVGDLMKTDNGIREVDVLQKSSRKWSIGLVPVGGGAFSWHDAETLRHHYAPTVEDVLREFAERWDDPAHYAKGELVDTFAAKLRLAGGEDA